MKTRSIILFAAFFMTLSLILGSKAFSQEQNQEKAKPKITMIGTGEMKYTCPMPGDMVFSSEAGKCPICGMNLKEMTPEDKTQMQKILQEMGMMNPGQGESITITGEIIDTACYIRGEMKGQNHVSCAKMCASAGIPLAVLDEKSNKIYLSIPAMGKNPNELFMPFIGERVTVTGAYLEKGGLSGIEIKKVERAK